MSSRSEYTKVWEVRDYGNLDALIALRARSSGGASGRSLLPKDAQGNVVFPEGMPTGKTTETVNGQIKPTAQTQQTAQDILSDPKAFVDQRIMADPKVEEQSLLDRGKSLLASIFDTSDTWQDGQFKPEAGQGPVESVWDTMLTGFNWVYDGINQVGSYAVSLAPGGLDTFEWDQAAEISWGQAAVTNQAKLNEQMGPLGGVAGALINPVGVIGGNAGEVFGAKFTEDSFDITNAEQRKAAFEDDTAGKWISGLTDTVITLAADPLIVGGKFLKVARLKYIDRPLTPKNQQAMIGELDKSMRLINEGQTENLPPIGQFLYDVMTPRKDGTRMPIREAIERDELKWSGDSEGIVDALLTLDPGDFDTAQLVLRTGLLDGSAIVELGKRSARALDTLANAKRQQAVQRVLADPATYSRAMADAERRADTAWKVYQTAQQRAKVNPALQQEADDAFKVWDNAFEDAKALSDGQIRLGIETPGQDELAYMASVVEEAAAKDQYFRRALDSAKQGAFVQADRGFASDTVLGRAVSKRRAAKARRAYERKSTSQQGVRTQDFFGANRFQRTVRFIHRLSDETPSYYISFAGGVDQHRELGAVFDSLEMYSGAGKTILGADGVERTIGGIAGKDAMMQKYVTARASGLDVSGAVVKIQEQIKNDLIDFYGIDRDLTDVLVKKAFGTYEDLTKQVTHTKNGFFLSDDAAPDGLKSLNVAPFLETQLSNGMYMLPWDEFERIVKNIQSGKVKPGSEHLLTPAQELGRRVKEADALFQDFWRPAVLFRLGYPQRNVAEGLFRSMVFNGSMMPLVWAGKAGLNSRQNFRRIQRAEKEAGKLRAAAGTGDQTARIEFDGLVGRQRELQDRQSMLFGQRDKFVQDAARRADADLPPSVEFQQMDEASGLMWTTDGKFQIQRTVSEITEEAAVPKFARQADGTYTASDGSVVIARSGKQWVVNDVQPDGSLVPREQLVRTLQDAKDQVAGNATPTTRTVEGWRINQYDDEAGVFIAGKRTFDSLDEAQSALTIGVDDVWNGRVAGGGPQLDQIAVMGQKARSRQPYEFTDPDTGRTYTSVDEIDADLAALADESKTVMDQIDAMPRRELPATLRGGKFETWRDNELAALDDAIEGQQEAIDDLVKLADDLEVGLDTQQRALLQFLRDVNANARSLRKALEMDDYFAIEKYSGQAAARRTVKNGSKISPAPGIILNDAYGNPLYRDIAWQNMSADNTIKATMAARLQLADSIIYKKRMQEYVDVDPSMGDRYWQGMELMLRQYGQSDIGKAIARGDTDEKIAMWLLEDPQGQQIVKSLDEAWDIAMRERAPENTGKIPPRIGTSMDRAVSYVAEVRESLELIVAGNRDVMEILKTGLPTAQQLQRLMGSQTNLSKVVGFTDEIVGYEKWINAYRKTTQRLFQKIGTQPEDALVRGPFYAERYMQTRDDMVALLEAQYGKGLEGVPVDVILNIEKNAHRRALKDTKDFLYTIDRRTKLGKYAESFFPFISATQNSITSIGRLTRRSPWLPGVMLQLWQAPTKVGLEDKDGNLVIPLPDVLVPDGVEDWLGLKGMDSIKINKSSLNVIFPETGFAFAPRPTPLIQAASSELMKQGLFGHYGVEAPKIMVSLMGQKDADTLWQQWKNYLYGEEQGISTAPLSYDKLFPPIANRLINYMMQDGSNQYAYQYGIQARTQDLLWRAGERDDYPTVAEIKDRTNGMFLLRMMGNAFAFTPPAYGSPVDALIEAQRMYDDAYGIEGPMKFSEAFGSDLMVLANTESTENVGGALSNTQTIRNIKKYSGFLQEVATGVGEENLDILGMFVNADMKESPYDPNSYRWMMTENIPGTNRKWREVNSGAEAMTEAQRQAGWVEYIKFKNALDGMLQDRGLESYRVKGAEDLKAYRDEFIDNMKDNPMYEGWATDYESMGSSKTYAAVNAIRKAISNEEFMADKADNKTWESAAIYLDYRDRLVQMVKESGVTLENEQNATLKAEWDAIRQELINRDLGWANIANRYLSGDDNPDESGASFTLGATA